MTKICTSLEQAKKLIELGIDVNTADMVYQSVEDEYGDGEWEAIPRNNSLNIGYDDDIPCWSLSALLDVLPVIIGNVLSENALRVRIDKSGTEFAVWYENLDSGMVEEGLDIIKNNPVDACYETIVKLKELKML